MIMSDQLIDEKNFYYSSDEDVSWGPLTLREIKREFAIPIKKPLFLKTACPLDREKYQDLQTSRSINSSNTDYCTANETFESNIKSDQIKDEMETKSSSLNSKEIVNFSKKLSSPNQISEEKESPDADAVIYVYSDESNEDFEHFRAKTEVTNSSNIDIISLSSDGERDYTNEKFYETDVGIENTFEKDNKVPNENISVNGKTSSSISFLNKTTDSAFETNCSINQYSSGSSTPDDSMKKHRLKYRISKNRSSANKSKNIEQANISANDSLREQRVKYRKSQSCIYSPNENIESTEFDNYETAINANSTSNIDRNESDEVMSLSTFTEEKSSNCSINQFSSGSSTPDDSIKKHRIKYRITKNRSSANKNKNIEQANISANDSLREQRVKYRKSLSCISSLNENIESTEFNNYGNVINANSASIIERNEWDEVIEEKSSNCSINQFSSGSSTPDDSMKKHRIKYRISKNRSSSNKNKHIEQENISADDSLRERVKYWKSQSCISSPNENIESTEFDNYETAINANSTSIIERNEWDEVTEKKSSNCSINQFSSGSSTRDDSMKKQHIKYRISKNRSSANKNKHIEQENISADDSLGERVKYWKSQSCICSPNENIESTEFDNCETAINANSTSNIERNEWDEVKLLSTYYEEKSSALNNSGNIKHSSFEHDSSTQECEIYKSKSIEGFTSESIEENSLEREKSRNFAVGKPEIDYNNHVYKCSNDENSRVFSNISSSEVDDKHKYKLNTSDDCADLNSEYSRSKLNYIEDLSFLDDTLSQLENLMKNGLEMNETATDEINETNLKYPVEENKILSHIEEPISRIPIFLSASNENKYTSMPSVSDFKMPNPRNAKKCLNVDKKLTPIKKSPNVFKNIISPVRIYIKNSSMPVLKQTHKPIMVKHTSSSIQETSESQPIKHRNLVKSFPEVIYKPSKKVIEKYDKEIILPDNIRKLVKERIVIKHEIRTKVDLNESELTTSEKLERADISHVISDERNMSVRTAKQGFNI